MVNCEWSKVIGNHVKGGWFSEKQRKCIRPKHAQSKCKIFRLRRHQGGEFQKKAVFGAKRNYKFALHQQGLLLSAFFKTRFFMKAKFLPSIEFFTNWKPGGIVFTLLALEFAMLIFHKAVGVYFANCTITIKAQTPTHGPCIKTWNSQSIMQMQMDCQKPTSLGIIDKGHICQTKPNLQEVEHMLVEQRFVQTPSTIQMPN